MRRWRSQLAALLALSTLLAGPIGCASGFPRRGADLPSTLETLLAPGEDARPAVRVERLRVFDARSEPWSEVDPAEIESGGFRPLPEGDYAVVAELRCAWRSRGEVHEGEAITWYYFRDGALYAFEHVTFERHCRRVPEIRGVAPASDWRETMPALLER